MADRDRYPTQLTQHHGQGQVQTRFRPEGGDKNRYAGNTPSAGQVLAVLAGVIVGGTFLTLSGLAFAGSVIGLLVTAPLFIIFSPVIVPAVFVLGLAVMGFLTSGAFGLTGLSSVSWLLNYLRQAKEMVPQQFEQAKRHAADTAGYLGQRTKDAGQEMQNRAHEGQKTGRDRDDK